MYNTNEIMTGDINNILMSGCRMDWPEMTEAHNPDVCIVFNAMVSNQHHVDHMTNMTYTSLWRKIQAIF